MKSLLILSLTIIFGISAFANISKYSDKLIYNGKEYELLNSPLESYFRKHPEKRSKEALKFVFLDAGISYNGYVATFEIKDSKIFLKDIVIAIRDTTTLVNPEKWKSILKEVFPEGEETKLDWLTEFFVTPLGIPIGGYHFGHMGEYKYEKYLFFKIVKGDLINEKEISNEQYKNFSIAQFKTLKGTKEFKKEQKHVRRRFKNVSADLSNEILDRIMDREMGYYKYMIFEK